MKNRDEMLDALRAYGEKGNMAKLKRHGLKPWWPFWADLPHVSITSTLTPDLLHQLHRGLIKDHVMTWLEELDAKTIDARFQAMPRAKDLCHF